MARRYLIHINIPFYSSEPPSPQVGDFYYNATTNKIGIYTSSGWNYYVSLVEDNSVTDAKIGNRSINQATTPTDTGTLTNLLSGLANRIAAITGETNWKTNPDTTIDELNQNVARKNVNESISGNWTFVNTIIGNINTASKWLTARTITLAGSITGSASIDGSADVNINTALANNSVNTANIVNGAVTLPKLGSDVINYIDSSGGGGGVSRGVPREFQEGGIIIPAYISPSNPTTNTNYGNIISAAFYSSKPVIAIVNPSNGPGSSVNTDYQTVIRRLVANNVYVGGYVSTQSGARSQTAVEADISQWNSLYPEVKILFLDEFPTTYNTTLATYYNSICEYARNLGFWLIIAKPGSTVDENWFTQSNQSPDIYVVYEGSGFPSVTLKNDITSRLQDGRYVKYRIASLVYNTTFNLFEAQWLVQNIGWNYITNDTTPNPWDSTGYIEQLASLYTNFDIYGDSKEERYKVWLSKMLTKYRRIFYASPTGSSGNGGTRQSPWNLTHAIAQLQEYDALILLSGAYNFTSASYQETVVDISVSNVGIFSEGLHSARIHNSGSTAYPMFAIRINDVASNVRVAGIEITNFPNIGIYCIGSNPHVAYNYIHDMRPLEGVDGGAGILLTDPGNAGTYTGGIIEGNHIHDIGDFDSNEWGTGTGGSTRVHGIYNNRRFVVIRNNLIYRIKAYGITHWRNPKNNQVLYNTIYLCRAGALSFGAGDVSGGSADNNIAVGNIFAHSYYGIREEGTVSATNSYINNLVWANTINTSLQNGTQNGTITEDPQLIYPAKPGNFKLSMNSPAIRAGEFTYLPELDFDLRYRFQADIGCYSYYQSDNLSTPFINANPRHPFSIPLPYPFGFPTTTQTVAISQITTTAATTQAMTSNRTYWLPFAVTRLLRITSFTLAVTTQTAGTATFYLYSTDSLGRPTKRITTTNASLYAINTGSTGVFTRNINIPLTPGIYWLAMHFSSTPTVRAIAVGGSVALGHVSGGTTNISHFYTTGAPTDPAPTSGYTAGTGNVPLIYINYVL